ncbi:MAG: murein biosynthesis integral membrane protein MurJ [Candidatus Levybacteria bacterium]|nr:murein biosynthesis integral membrane protein MurJ [Candidatus Levybacteria bacterium]
MNDFLKKSFSVLLRQQTNILSAAYIIMATVIFSQLLGLVRNRLLVSIFGASNTLGIYNYSLILPDTIFQLVVASALASAFIPVFVDYIKSNKEKEGYKMASNLLILGLGIFGILSAILALFAPFILSLFNLGSNFTADQITLMASLMRLVIIGQLLFIIASLLTAILQSYNHFFIPGFAAALYNLGTISGIFLLHSSFGIYSAPLGGILGGLLYIVFQLPLAFKFGFRLRPVFSQLLDAGVKKIIHLMWPRALQNGVQQFGTVALGIIIAFLTDPGRMFLLFDYAKVLMFAPVSLVGFSIAQAAFPILSRENSNMEEFKSTFLNSAYQMLYLILPISALLLVLRIPIVRLIYGADLFDWDATVLTGRTLAFFSFSIFAQALIGLFYRAFYALHNTKIPLLTSIIGTLSLIFLAYFFVNGKQMGIESIAFAFTLANILQLLVLFVILDKKTGKFNRKNVILSLSKLFFATIIMAFALYVPIKLLDQLVFDTTRTVNLLMLTGISSAAGISLYFFCTWLLSIREANTYLMLLKKVGNWREILYKNEEVIEATRINP